MTSIESPKALSTRPKVAPLVDALPGWFLCYIMSSSSALDDVFAFLDIATKLQEKDRIESATKVCQN